MDFESISQQRYLSIKELVVEAIGGGVQAEDIKGETNLYDLGLDSFNVINLLVGIEARFGATIAPEELTEDVFTRFDGLVSMVEKHL